MSDRGIEEILRRYPRPYQPLSQIEFLGGAGGYSGARLWRYPSRNGLMVLRGWPPHGPDRRHLEQIHRWLTRAAGLGFIPSPIADISGQTLQRDEGTFYEVAPWLPGEPDRSRPPAPARLRSAFSSLAAFHIRFSSERHEGFSQGLKHRHESLVQLIEGGLDTLDRAIQSTPSSCEPLTQVTARRWVELARTVAPRLLDPLRISSGRFITLQPCLRDARPDHFLFEDDRLTGLVDFGAMGDDCVAGDLARLMNDWLDDDSPARIEALDAYERVRPLDTAEASFIDVFESSLALLIGEHWVRWHFLEGRRFDDPRAVTRGIARGLARPGAARHQDASEPVFMMRRRRHQERPKPTSDATVPKAKADGSGTDAAPIVNAREGPVGSGA